MRNLTVATLVLVVSYSAWAQQPAPAAPPPPPTDPSKAAFLSAADFAAAIAKTPTDRTGNVPVFRLAPYNVGVEHRLTGPQMAAIHDREAELFYVIDGAGTIVTGGTLVGVTRTNQFNWAGTSIKDGASRPIAKGDFIMVPEGIPHWFSEIKGSLTQIALHLPRAEAQVWTGRIWR